MNLNEEPIVNKVAQSGLITIDLEEFLFRGDVVEFDMKEHLFQGLILKEKDFRAFIKDHDWEQYSGKVVAVFCSTDAIVPTWAYMLVANKLSGIAASVHFNQAADVKRTLLIQNVDALDITEFADQRVVIKGCGDDEVSPAAYVRITERLTPIVKNIMYGEPCSTVPIYKKKVQR